MTSNFEGNSQLDPRCGSPALIRRPPPVAETPSVSSESKVGQALTPESGQETEEQTSLRKKSAQKVDIESVSDRLYEDSKLRRERLKHLSSQYEAASTPKFAPTLCGKSRRIMSSKFSDTMSVCSSATAADRLYESAKSARARREYLRQQYAKMENANLTFKPKINPVFKGKVVQYFDKESDLLKPDATTSTSIASSPKITSTHVTEVPVWDRLSSTNEIQKREAANLKKKLAQELKECTFSAKKSVQKIREEQGNCLKRALTAAFSKMSFYQQQGPTDVALTVDVTSEKKLPIAMVSDIRSPHHV